MTNWLFVILIIALVILFGAYPLHVLSILFKAIAIALNSIAKAINFFGFGGIV